MKKKEETFEEAMVKLREAVDRLDRGGLTLEETLAAYEEGHKYARFCQKKLEDAKGRFVRLEEGADGIEERPSEPPSDE